MAKRNISIHASHAGRDFIDSVLDKNKVISIHASHAGRDLYKQAGNGVTIDFNPRVPCGTRL